MRVDVRMMIVTGTAVAMLGCGSGETTGPQADAGDFDVISSGVDASTTTPDGTTTTPDGTATTPDGTATTPDGTTTTPDGTATTPDTPDPVDPVCGDGICEGTEDCVSCADDCDACALAPGLIVITEIMQNPDAVGDEVGEWFEVLNVSSGPVNLNGLTLSDGNQDMHVIDAGGALHVMPGQRAVLAATSDMGVGVAPDYVYADFLLGNKSDAIILSAGEVVIDSVAYDNGATFPDPTGASMRLDDAAATAEQNDDGANWCPGVEAYAAGDLGTPGFENGNCVVACGDGLCSASETCEACPQDCGACATCGDGSCDAGETCESCEADCGACSSGGLVPGDVIITEIMNNPDAVGDDIGEWFEVLNPTATAVDLQGAFLMSDNDGDYEITVPVSVAPGEYIVLAVSADLGLGGVDLADHVFSGLTFGNGSDSLSIWYDGVLIDSVAYDNGATFPDEKGKAMSLDPAANNPTANDDGANWCGASDAFVSVGGVTDYGTPGAANPGCLSASCGDGTCDADETCTTCVADCGACGGAGSCCDVNATPACEDAAVTACVCEIDDFCCTDFWDDLCVESAIEDCGACAGCGDGTCDADETCADCEADCGPCTTCEPVDETCNGVDDDCDQMIDEDATLCDDGIGCTANECLGADGCTNPIAEDYCVIGGQCVVEDAPNPNSVCESCQPFTSTSDWTTANGGGCDDGNPCTDNDMCSGGTCEGQPVVVPDIYEPNNHNSEAYNLGEAKDSDDFPVGSVTAVMSHDETQDWYKYHTDDTGTLFVDTEPRVVLTQPAGANYRICIHMQCEDSEGMAELDCKAGELSTNSVGYVACCDDGADGTTDVRFQPDCGGIFGWSEDGMTYIEITRNGTEDICEEYSFQWGDD